MSAEAAAIRSAGLREGSDGQPVLIKHRLSPAGSGSRTFVTSPDRLGGVLAKTFWGSSLQPRQEYIQQLQSDSCKFLKFSCFLLLHICARVFKKIHHLMIPNPLIFL